MQRFDPVREKRRRFHDDYSSVACEEAAETSNIFIQSEFV